MPKWSAYGRSMLSPKWAPYRFVAGARAPRFDFRISMPDPDLFPRTTWRRLVAEAAREAPHGVDAMPPAGLPELRESLSRYLERRRGISCRPESIVVTTGFQQGFQLCVRLLCGERGTVLMENPCYPTAREIVRTEGSGVVSVPVDGEGIDVSQLKRRDLERVRLAYTTPAHQFPYGVIMSFRRRRALLEWAARAGAIVFEDDYDSELRFSGPPIEPLHSLASTDCVIYGGSFSKLLGADLRLGYLVIPDALVESFTHARWLAGWSNPLLEQHALARLLDSEEMHRHVRRVRRIYGRRRSLLLEHLHKSFGDGIEVVGDDAGLHVYVDLGDLPPSRRARLQKLAAKRGVAVVSADACFARPARSAGLLLGYGRLTEKEISAAVEAMASCVRETGSRASAWICDRGRAAITQPSFVEESQSHTATRKIIDA